MMLMMLAAPARPGISNAQSPPLNHRAWGVTCRPTDLKWVAHSFMKRPPHIENWAAGIGAWEGFGEYTDLVALFTIYNILLHENPQVLWSRSRRAELVRVH